MRVSELSCKSQGAGGYSGANQMDAKITYEVLAICFSSHAAGVSCKLPFIANTTGSALECTGRDGQCLAPVRIPGGALRLQQGQCTG